MNLGELKKALTRFPPDMDSEAVMLHSKTSISFDLNPLALLAVADEEGIHCVILSTTTTNLAITHGGPALTLGGLKRGITKLPPDMNNEEVMLHTQNAAGPAYGPLAFVAIPKDTDAVCVVLGTEDVAKEIIRRQAGG